MTRRLGTRVSSRLTNVPRHERFALPNGLQVLLAPQSSSPTASVWVWYRVGSKNEWPGITGASHWVEHMLFQGSPKYPKGETDRAIVAVGGSLNAFTDTDFTAYLNIVPREYLDLPLAIEADRMTRALIAPKEVERERTVIHSEREGNENWPEFRAEEELYSLAFRFHPYRWDPLGRRVDIEQLTAEQLQTYYHRFYGTKNALLVVTGGFDLRSTRREIQRRFSSLPSGGDDPTVRIVEPPARGERRSRLTGPGTTPLLEIGWRSPALPDPETPATMLLDVLLGGEARLFSAGAGWGRSAEHPSSRLYRALVEPGLAVRASSMWRPRLHPGLFTIGAQAAPGVSIERLERAVDEVIERFIRLGPTALEMADARAKVIRGAALAYEGATRTAFRLGYFATLNAGDVERQLLRNILKTSAAATRSRARELFRPESRTTVIYEPKGGPGAGSD